MNKVESRLRWRELTAMVNEWDPVGLIAAGAPNDEYDCIVGDVLRALERGDSEAALAHYLKEHIGDHFGADPGDPAAFAIKAAVWYRARIAEGVPFERAAIEAVIGSSLVAPDVRRQLAFVTGIASEGVSDALTFHFAVAADAPSIVPGDFEMSEDLMIGEVGVVTVTVSVEGGRLRWLSVDVPPDSWPDRPRLIGIASYPEP
jgi:hypothetical protein